MPVEPARYRFVLDTDRRILFDGLDGNYMNWTLNGPSGLVFEARHGENWMDCASEHKKLLALAAEFRILMLSGDIHENRIAPPYAKPGAPPGGRCMFEITSSGAALRTGVTLGALQCNWGLLDIDSTTIRVQLSQLGMAPRTRTIDRQSWTMLPPPESP